MARQADKSYYLKRLFDVQMVKTDPKASPSARNDQAAQLMDELVGPRWREEVNAEMELVPDLDPKPSCQEVEDFWGNVQLAGYEAGFGTEKVEHDEPQDAPDCSKSHPPRQPSVIAMIQQLLGMKKLG
jgi:hypothetical protein